MALKFVPQITASMGVTDLDRSIAWYRSVLGFAIVKHNALFGFCELSSHMPGVNVVLSQREQVAQGGGATNVWSVADITAAKAHLDAHGVRQDGGIRDIPSVVRLLTFYDPDQNAMMFAQSLSTH